MWLAVFCLVGLAPAIAVKLAPPPATLVVEPAQDRSQIEPAFAVNESTKSDRLELPQARAEPGIIGLAATPPPAETASASPQAPPTAAETVSPETDRKIADRPWRDANASLIPVAPPRRHPKSRELKQSAGTSPPGKRAEVWHCRQDAVGSLLRSLDLSPRCDL